MSSSVFEVLHDSIEGGASAARGDTYGVHVQFDGNDSPLVAAAHLVGDVEDEGGVHAVVEQHSHIKEVPVGIHYIRLALDTVGVLTADAEGHQTAADDIYRLALLVAVVLQPGAVVDGDGVVTRGAGVERGGTCHS